MAPITVVDLPSRVARRRVLIIPDCFWHIWREASPRLRNMTSTPEIVSKASASGDRKVTNLRIKKGVDLFIESSSQKSTRSQSIVPNTDPSQCVSSREWRFLECGFSRKQDRIDSEAVSFCRSSRGNTNSLRRQVTVRTRTLCDGLTSHVKEVGWSKGRRREGAGGK